MSNGKMHASRRRSTISIVPKIKDWDLLNRSSSKLRQENFDTAEQSPDSTKSSPSHVVSAPIPVPFTISTTPHTSAGSSPKTPSPHRNSFSDRISTSPHSPNSLRNLKSHRSTSLSNLLRKKSPHSHSPTIRAKSDSALLDGYSDEKSYKTSPHYSPTSQETFEEKFKESPTLAEYIVLKCYHKWVKEARIMHVGSTNFLKDTIMLEVENRTRELEKLRELNRRSEINRADELARLEKLLELAADGAIKVADTSLEEFVEKKRASLDRHKARNKKKESEKQEIIEKLAAKDVYPLSPTSVNSQNQQTLFEYDINLGKLLEEVLLAPLEEGGSIFSRFASHKSEKDKDSKRPEKRSFLYRIVDEITKPNGIIINYKTFKEIQERIEQEEAERENDTFIVGEMELAPAPKSPQQSAREMLGFKDEQPLEEAPSPKKPVTLRQKVTAAIETHLRGYLISTMFEAYRNRQEHYTPRCIVPYEIESTHSNRAIAM